MLRIFLLFTLIISLLLTACGQAATAQPAASPTPEKSDAPTSEGPWTIRMMHSGGIMGLARSIEISSDGKFKITDERLSTTITGELSSDELSKINELVSTAEFIAASKPDGMGCADCFVYDLEIQRNDDSFLAQLNDLNLHDSGLAPLVDHLRGLIDTNLR